MANSFWWPIGKYVECQSQVDERLRQAILDKNDAELRIETVQRVLDLSNARLKPLLRWRD